MTIYGRVAGYEARVSVTFRLPNLPDAALEFVVDTGFEGALTLPSSVITALGLPFIQEMTTYLANHETERADVYLARIVWDGFEQHTLVLAMGKRPLLGTALLNGKRLCVDFADGGLVIIDDLT